MPKKRTRRFIVEMGHAQMGEKYITKGHILTWEDYNPSNGQYPIIKKELDINDPID